MRRRTLGRAVATLLTLGLCLAGALAMSGLMAAAPASGAPVSAARDAAPGYVPPPPLDASRLSWLAAFDALYEKMAREYAFTEWKGIDFPGLYAEYLPRVLRAQDAGDETAYYVTLREFTHEFRDGHVSVKARDAGGQALMARAQRQLAGGGFGLIATTLDDGRTVAAWVEAGGPADQAGIELGAELVAWGGRPIAAALARTSTALSPNMPTGWRLAYERARFLVRAPAGAVRAVSFRNPGAKALRTARLTAADDGLETLTMTNAGSVFSWSTLPDSTVEAKVLDGNVGYVRVYCEVDAYKVTPGDTPKTLDQFRAAIQSLRDARVDGLIVDLRNNGGGSDQMASQILGSLYRSKAFYEYSDLYNPLTGTFQIWVGDDATGTFGKPGQGIWIEPATPQYAGRLVLLVNNGCISSGEGVAKGIKRVPGARVVGFSGTNGSFGAAGDVVLMPLGLEIDFPFGRTLDEHHRVQIDARHGAGGVTPTDRIPMTLRNAVRHWRGDDVELAYGLKVLSAMK